MGCRNGEFHKMWKQEEKLKIVKSYLEGEKPKELSKKYGVNSCLIHVWSKQYNEQGAERLISQNGIQRLE